LLIDDLSWTVHFEQTTLFWIMQSLPITQLPRMIEFEILHLAPMETFLPMTDFWMMQPSPI
jgi:hypothetical protein